MTSSLSKRPPRSRHDAAQGSTAADGLPADDLSLDDFLEDGERFDDGTLDWQDSSEAEDASTDGRSLSEVVDGMPGSYGH